MLVEAGEASRTSSLILSSCLLKKARWPRIAGVVGVVWVANGCLLAKLQMPAICNVSDTKYIDGEGLGAQAPSRLVSY